MLREGCSWTVAVKAVWGRVEHSHVAVRGLDWPYDIAFTPQ